MLERKKVRIEIKIGDPENPELHITGLADEEIVDQTFKFFGLRYTPPEKAVAVPAPVKVYCTHRSYCIDYPKKCGECANNEVKSYFKPKEKGKKSD